MFVDESDKVIHIDTSLIPPIDGKLLGRAFYEELKEFYSDPENVKKFEAWRAKQEVKKVCEKS